MKSAERHRIRLPALKRLYWQMKRADRMRVQFDYTHPNNGQVFVVMFLADTDPYQLVLATRGINPFVAIFSINTEFEVDPWVKDVGRLMDLLGVSRAPRIPGKSPWRLTQFLREVTASAPKDVGAAKDASPPSSPASTATSTRRTRSTSCISSTTDQAAAIAACRISTRRGGYSVNPPTNCAATRT